MNNQIAAYLSVTRGQNNYMYSNDEVVDILVGKLKAVLRNNKISVIVIWSTQAKNEVVTLNDDTKVIVWDVNYWTYCAQYYQNLLLLNQHIIKETDLVEIQCDALWRDLLRVIIYRSNQYTAKAKLLLTKYYLSYGNRTYPIETAENGMGKVLTDLATAKTYALLHEIAHITLTNEIDYYINILKKAVSGETQERIYSEIVFKNRYLKSHQKQLLKQSLHELENEIKTGAYDLAIEIIADMRALHSMCTSFMLRCPNESIDRFIDFRDGIALARSYNLRLWIVEKYIDEIINDTGNISLYDKPFIYRFILRDSLAEILQNDILMDCFRNDCSISFLLKYSADSIIQQQTITSIDRSIEYHLNSIIRIASSELNDEENYAYPIDNIISYLLYYSKESDDNSIINNPKSKFGFTGLLL